MYIQSKDFYKVPHFSAANHVEPEAVEPECAGGIHCQLVCCHHFHSDSS